MAKKILKEGKGSATPLKEVALPEELTSKAIRKFIAATLKSSAVEVSIQKFIDKPTPTNALHIGAIVADSLQRISTASTVAKRAATKAAKTAAKEAPKLPESGSNVVDFEKGKKGKKGKKAA